MGDLTTVVKAASGFTAQVAISTLTCGQIDNTCTWRVAAVIKHFATLATSLGAASVDCDPRSESPLVCTVDMFTGADAIANVALDIHRALKACNPGRQSY